MPRTYTVNFALTTVATASGDVDLFEVTPADDKPVEIVGMLLGVTTEVGDAAEEIVALQIIRGHATSGTSGSAATPTPLDPVDTAAGFTAEVLNTGIASAGTGVICAADTFNLRAGYQIWFPDGCGPRASQANSTIVVRMMSTVTDDVSMTGSLFVREV